MFSSLATGVAESVTKHHAVLEADLTCNLNIQKTWTTVICCWGSIVY
jgi:hypothetical protein